MAMYIPSRLHPSSMTWPNFVGGKEGNWHEAISRNKCGVRPNTSKEPVHDYDIVIGPIADDRVDLQLWRYETRSIDLPKPDVCFLVLGAGIEVVTNGVSLRYKDKGYKFFCLSKLVAVVVTFSFPLFGLRNR